MIIHSRFDYTRFDWFSLTDVETDLDMVEPCWRKWRLYSEWTDSRLTEVKTDSDMAVLGWQKWRLTQIWPNLYWWRWWLYTNLANSWLVTNPDLKISEFPLTQFESFSMRINFELHNLKVENMNHSEFQWEYYKIQSKFQKNLENFQNTIITNHKLDSNRSKHKPK